MSDEPTGTPETGPEGETRRKTDRRKSQQSFEGPDRREGERRSGADRRNNPRH